MRFSKYFNQRAPVQQGYKETYYGERQAAPKWQGNARSTTANFGSKLNNGSGHDFENAATSSKPESNFKYRFNYKQSGTSAYKPQTYAKTYAGSQSAAVGYAASSSSAAQPISHGKVPLASSHASMYANYSPPPQAASPSFRRTQPKDVSTGSNGGNSNWYQKQGQRQTGSPTYGGQQVRARASFPTNEMVSTSLKFVASVEREAGNLQKAIIFYAAAKKVNSLTSELLTAKDVEKVPGFGESLKTLIGDLLEKGDSTRCKYAQNYALVFNTLRTLPDFDSAQEWLPVSKAIDFSLPQPVSETVLESLPARARNAVNGALKYGNALLEPINEAEVNIMSGFLNRCLQALSKDFDAVLCGAARRFDFSASSCGYLPLLISHKDFQTTPESTEELESAYASYVKPLLESLKKHDFVKEVWEESAENLRACAIFQLKEVPNSPVAKNWNPRRLMFQLVPKDAFYASVAKATGDDAFWNFLVQTALNSSYSLGPDGLCKWQGRGKTKQKSEPIILSSEEELFEKLNLRYFNPRERTNSFANPLSFAMKKMS